MHFKREKTRSHEAEFGESESESDEAQERDTESASHAVQSTFAGFFEKNLRAAAEISSKRKANISPSLHRTTRRPALALITRA